MTRPLDRYTLEQAAEMCDAEVLAAQICVGKLSGAEMAATTAAALAKQIRALASTLPKEPAVPEGWKLVPVEPSYGMLKALAGEPLILAGSDEHELRLRYAAMLAAAPSGKE